MTQVAGYLTRDPGWLDAGTPPGAEGLAEAMGPVDDLKKRLADKPGQVGAEFQAGAMRQGVEEFKNLVETVDFPQFVSGLIHGVFQAIVDASIQQMEAFGDLLAATAKSVDEFANDHIADDQAREQIASRFPSIVRLERNTEEGGGTKLAPATEDTSDFTPLQQFARTNETVDFNDGESERKFLAAAKLELARQRQKLMALMVLLGINRIVVTDGKINAKLKFDFRATDTGTKHAQKFDYQEFAPIHTEQKVSEGNTETGADYKKEGGWWGAEQGTSKRWTKDTTQIVDTPVIQVTGITDTTNTAQLEASAKLSGEVSLNFKSETFDLNKLASADEVFRLERVRSAGRGAPAPGGSGSPTNGKTAGNGAAPPDGQAAAGNTPAAAAPAPGA